jgi:hypothetical protein
MEFNEYDFTQNPVVQNDVVFLQSKCTACGFSILVRSVEELVEHEAAHRTQCRQSNSVRSRRKDDSFSNGRSISDYGFKQLILHPKDAAAVQRKKAELDCMGD